MPAEHLQRLCMQLLQLLKLEHHCFWYFCRFFLICFSLVIAPTEGLDLLKGTRNNSWARSRLPRPPNILWFHLGDIPHLFYACCLRNCTVGASSPPRRKCPSVQCFSTRPFSHLPQPCGSLPSWLIVCVWVYLGAQTLTSPKRRHRLWHWALASSWNKRWDNKMVPVWYITLTMWKYV
jgi:hypothetical protein